MDDRKNKQVAPNGARTPHSRPPRSTGGLPNPNEPVMRPNLATHQGQSQRQAQPMQKVNTTPTDTPIKTEQPPPPPKKRGKGKIIALGIVGAVVLGMFGIRAYNKSKPKPVVKPEMAATIAYEQSGRFALDTYLGYLKNYDHKAIKTVSPDSWVAKEWDYANSNELRQNWVKSVCAYLEFTYPQMEALDVNGDVYISDTGEKVTLDSDMLNNETITVTVVDFNTLAVTMQEDIKQIIDAYEASGYSPSDYTYNDEMVELMLDYLLSKSNYPTKLVEVQLPLGTKSTEADTSTEEPTTNSYVGSYILTDDSALDKILFSSEDFHLMCDTYSSLIIDYEYKALNDAYNADVAKRDAEIQADKDALTARLEAEEITQVEYDLLAEDIRFTPEELDAKKAEENLRISDDVYAELTTPKKEYPEIPPVAAKDELFGEESVVPYTWCGAYFCKNEYDGELSKEPQVGDGSFELPAGIGTEIVTKALCSDGKFHDIKVTLMSYCTGEAAINYAQRYSEKNRGWDKDSMTQLICYEVKIENLEGVEVTLDSQLYLSDKNSNQSTRTGSIFGFTESITLKPYEEGFINDWATSTELPYKYLCWGSEFNREYPAVWFKVLAGSGGELDDFDATLSYVGVQNAIQQDEEVTETTTE